MKRAICAALLILMGMFGAPAGAQPAEPQKINIGLAFVANGTLPIWIAQDKGLFKKHGLDPKLVSFQGSAAATQALMSGSVDVVFGSASAAITLVGRGAPVVVVSSVQILDYWLVGRPNLTSVEQLRGGTLGIGAFSGGDDFAARRLLPLLGLSVDKDVKFVVLGTPNPYQKAVAVLNGNVDATLSVDEVVSTLKTQGKPMSVLASTLDRGIKLSVGDILVTRPYLQKSPDAVKGFLRAIAEAVRLAKNDKQLSFELLRKHLNMENPVILEDVYKGTVLARFEDVPYPNADSIATQRDDLADTAPGLAGLKGMGVEAFLDNAPIKALEQEGFFAKLPPLKKP